MTAGKRLKFAIRKIGLTQQDIADKFGIDRSLLSKLYNDKQNMSKLFLYALKSEFGINPDWLLTGEGDMFLQNGVINKTTGSNSPIISGNNNSINYNLTQDEAELVDSYREGNGRKLLKLLAKLLPILLFAWLVYWFWPGDDKTATTTGGKFKTVITTGGKRVSLVE